MSKPAVQYCILSAVSPKKSEIRLSPNGCVTAAIKRSKTLTEINSTNGSINMESIRKMPILPKEFLMSTLPATARSNPPDKKPPTIGIPLPMAYFAARRTTPSYIAVVIPCKVKNIPKTETHTPIIHLLILLKNAVNFPIFSSFVRLLAMENKRIVTLKGKTTDFIVETIVPEKKATAGR